MQQVLSQRPGNQQVNLLAGLGLAGPNNDILSNGLLALKYHCETVYPPSIHGPPLVWAAERSFIREGGTEPLDFIYIFKNEGANNGKVPRHWHYIGFGLSDIHGYGYLCKLDMSARANNPALITSDPLPDVYPLPSERHGRLSGFGFELTFRIGCNSDDEWSREPPRWPAEVMQALAKYIFKSKNIFHAGDHVAWHRPLDKDDSTIIRHMLMTSDPQMNEIQTRFGEVKFIQLVGVCDDELQKAREWNVKGVLDLMKEHLETGGEYLVTDMRRGASLFDSYPGEIAKVDDGISRVGSDMALVSAKHRYSSSRPKWFDEAERSGERPDRATDHFIGDDEDENMCDEKTVPERGDLNSQAIETGFLSDIHNGAYRDDAPTEDVALTRTPSRMSYESESGLLLQNAEIAKSRFYNQLFLWLSYESARIIPIMLKGRLQHRHHFTYQSFRGDLSTTFIPEGYPDECLVEQGQPYVRHGSWLQVFIPQRLREQMMETIGADFGEFGLDESELPKNYSWPEFNLHITVDKPDKEAN